MTEDSRNVPSRPRSGAIVDADHLRKEGWTMALYVAICLIACAYRAGACAAVPGHILGLVWGTTVGLALAHVFAFRIAGRLVHDGEPKADRIVSVVQLAMPPRSRSLSASRFCWPRRSGELNWARYTCAAIIGLVGYLVARGASRGGSVRCSSASEYSWLLFAVAVLKHALAGH